MSDVTGEAENENINNGIDKPHNGRPITKIEISPNEEYIVTYSVIDHSIFGWNIKDKGSFPNEDDVVSWNSQDEDLLLNDDDDRNVKDEGSPKPELFVKLESAKRLYQMVISDDKNLAYIDNYEHLGKS